MEGGRRDASRIRVAPFAVAFGVIAALICVDLVQDARSGTEVVHLGLEGVAMLVAVAGGGLAFAVVWRDRSRARREAAQARVLAASATERAEALAADAARWRAEARALLDGLGAAIEGQFARWGLTEAEAEVALLLLKGLPTKEIARIRQTSDRTVRQQARAVYAKAGLGGRAELSAFFLEDLLLPR